MNEKMARAIRKSGRERDMVRMVTMREEPARTRVTTRGTTVVHPVSRRRAMRLLMGSLTARRRGELRRDLEEQGRIVREAARNQARIDRTTGVAQ